MGAINAYCTLEPTALRLGAYKSVIALSGV